MLKLKKRVIRDVLKFVSKEDLVEWLRKICIKKHLFPCSEPYNIKCKAKRSPPFNSEKFPKKYSFNERLEKTHYDNESFPGQPYLFIEDPLYKKDWIANCGNIFVVQDYIYASPENLENIINQIEAV